MLLGGDAPEAVGGREILLPEFGGELGAPEDAGELGDERFRRDEFELAVAGSLDQPFGVPPQRSAEATTLVSRTTRTRLAKLGAHRLQFGFEFGPGDLDAAGLAQAAAVID